MELLQIIVLAAHLLLVNVAGGGPVVCIWLEWMGRRKKSAALDQAGRRLASGSLLYFFVGAVLGTLLLGMMYASGDEVFFLALKRLPKYSTKLTYTGLELLFFIACLLGYIIWWKFSPRDRLWQRILHRLLAILAATNVMWHFPTLFGVVEALATDVGATEEITKSEFRKLMYGPAILTLSFHTWFAMIATAGIVVMGYALRPLRGTPTDEEAGDARLVATTGARIALIVTVLQLPIGIWVMLSLPASQQNRLMGGDLMATGAFGLAIILALGLMHFLAAVAMGKVTRKSIIFSMAMLSAVVLTMCVALHAARNRATEVALEMPDAVEPVSRAL